MKLWQLAAGILILVVWFGISRGCGEQKNPEVMVETQEAVQTLPVLVQNQVPANPLVTVQSEGARYESTLADPNDFKTLPEEEIYTQSAPKI